MIEAHFLGRYLAIGIATGALALSSVTPVQAQSTNEDGSEINVSSSKGQEPTALKHHVRRANTVAGRSGRSTETRNSKAASAVSNAASTLPRTLYPGDLSYQGGPVVEYAQSHPVYLYAKSVGCTTPGCWGNPATFLQNLGQSNLIHVLDQYIGNSADDRYTVGKAFHQYLPKASPTAPLFDTDMAAFAHEAAKQLGAAGYGHIFHIFLPPGQDVCFDATTGTCYSPDVPATFFFCAYHGFADFSDGSHVLYTVEPYQNVSGCNIEPGTPNGELVDATADTLSHETSEIITDPDLDAWFNTASLSLNGEEIGDECLFLAVIGSNTYIDEPAFLIGHKVYAVQREYNNHKHGCTEGP